MRFNRRTAGVALVAAAVGALGAPAGYSAAQEVLQEVLIANGEEQPIPTKAIGTTSVREDRGEPFTQSGHSPRINVGSGYYAPKIDVPAGKDLIVDRVSAQATGALDLRPRPAIVAAGGSSIFDQSAPRLFLAFVPGPAEGSASFNEEVDLFVPSRLSLGFNSRGGTLSINVALDWTVVGHLVDEPAP